MKETNGTKRLNRMTPEEISCFEGVLKGDNKAFERLFYTYQPRMFVFCFNFFHDESLAKEVVQESFVQLFENRNRIQSPESVSAYLFRIVRNRCLNEVRNQAFRKRFVNIDDLFLKEMELESLSDEHSLFDPLVSSELDSLIAQAFKALSDRCQQVIRMSREKGMKYKEIASELRISERTVENEIYRGLKTLKSALSGMVKVVVLFVMFGKLV